MSRRLGATVDVVRAAQPQTLDKNRNASPDSLGAVYNLQAMPRLPLRFLSLIPFMLLHVVVRADTPAWLEALRSYDLNDYALGVAVTSSQSPYVNAKNSTWAYPVLTTLQHYSMTDDWLLLRRGGAGIRAVTESGWTYGVFAGVDTGGLGNGDPEELRGLLPREWTLEAGPFVSYRGWPLHIELDTYFDVLGRSNGYTGELTFSLPQRFNWGYLVPSVELIRADGDYNNYYYGISELEVLEDRPLYIAGSDTNVAVGIDYGYRVGDRWLLFGNVSMQWFGDEITASPIVDRDRALSARIGVAYNADLFNAREVPYADYAEPRVGIRIGSFYDAVSTKAQRTNEDGIPGDTIDFESSLDAPDSQWVAEAGLSYRVGAYHRFDIGYFELGRNSNVIASEDFEFGDIVIPAGAPVDVRSDFSTTVISYSYSVLKDAQKELGVTAGLHFTDFDAVVSVVDGESEAVKGSVSLPVIGAFGSVAIGEKMRLAARVQVFASDVDRYEGNLYYGTLDLTRRVADRLRIGLGLNLYSLRVESATESIRGEFESRHVGPVLFISTEF